MFLRSNLRALLGGGEGEVGVGLRVEVRMEAEIGLAHDLFFDKYGFISLNLLAESGVL